jgi:hypothetical protein
VSPQAWFTEVIVDCLIARTETPATHQPVEARNPRDLDGMMCGSMSCSMLASSRPCWIWGWRVDGRSEVLLPTPLALDARAVT